MRRLAIAFAAVALLAPAAAHARVDNGAKPVLLITGEETGPVDCKAYWNDTTTRLRRFSMTVQGATVKFTGSLETLSSLSAPNCPSTFRGDTIEAQAKSFSEWLMLEYKGEDVDVVAQGTAGVMVRYAMAPCARACAIA